MDGTRRQVSGFILDFVLYHIPLGTVVGYYMVLTVDILLLMHVL